MTGHIISVVRRLICKIVLGIRQTRGKGQAKIEIFVTRQTTTQLFVNVQVV